MTDHSADYCPACGQPRERAPKEVERMGIKLLPNRTLVAGGSIEHLQPREATFARAILERGSVSHEFLMLQFDGDAWDQITRVYACRVRRKLLQLTGGLVDVRAIYGWGYELVSKEAA